MKVNSVTVCNFRNYGDFSVSFDSGINVLCGKNGIGKTNLLEGIFLFAGRKDIGGEVVYKGLKERGVLVRFWNTEKLKDFCRITVGTREENDRLLSALKELLSAFCAV